jgi:hypothetical protein
MSETVTKDEQALRDLEVKCLKDAAELGNERAAAAIILNALVRQTAALSNEKEKA